MEALRGVAPRSFSQVVTDCLLYKDSVVIIDDGVPVDYTGWMILCDAIKKNKVKTLRIREPENIDDVCINALVESLRDNPTLTYFGFECHIDLDLNIPYTSCLQLMLVLQTVPNLKHLNLGFIRISYDNVNGTISQLKKNLDAAVCNIVSSAVFLETLTYTPMKYRDYAHLCTTLSTSRPELKALSVAPRFLWDCHRLHAKNLESITIVGTVYPDSEDACDAENFTEWLREHLRADYALKEIVLPEVVDEDEAVVRDFLDPIAELLLDHNVSNQEDHYVLNVGSRTVRIECQSMNTFIDLGQCLFTKQMERNDDASEAVLALMRAPRTRNPKRSKPNGQFSQFQDVAGSHIASRVWEFLRYPGNP